MNIRMVATIIMCFLASVCMICRSITLGDFLIVCSIMCAANIIVHALLRKE